MRPIRDLKGHINSASPTPVSRISANPGSSVLRSAPEAAERTIPPLTTVLDMVARTTARAAMCTSMLPLPLSSAMDSVIASTSARPETILETRTPASPK